MCKVIKESITHSLSFSLCPLISQSRNPFLASKISLSVLRELLTAFYTTVRATFFSVAARCSFAELEPFFLLTRHKLWHLDNGETTRDIFQLTLAVATAPRWASFLYITDNPREKNVTVICNTVKSNFLFFIYPPLSLLSSIC